MDNLEKTALYCIDFEGYFYVVIPKKKQDGYLRCAFGGHHVNEASLNWENQKPRDVQFESDIDGYVSFHVPSKWSKSERRQEFLKTIEDLKESLSKTFPQITLWKEVPFEIIGDIAMRKRIK